MPLSFGIASKIMERPEYNLGVALPFICAFYIANAEPLLTSVLGVEISADVSNVITIIAVGAYYYFFVLFAALASHFSLLIEVNKGWLAIPMLVLVMSGVSLASGDVVPRVPLYFAALSVLVLVAAFCGKHAAGFSCVATSFLGAIVALVCASTGLLWFFGQPILEETVASALGLVSVASASVKLGGLMLIATGYVIFYGVFKINETEEP